MASFRHPIEKLDSEQFPGRLSEIPDPPSFLYMRGTPPPPGHKLVTIVGSRQMSQYGKDVVDHLVAGLAGYPVVIVSGMALGVDGAAHRAALKYGLQTIAFPGS